MKIIIACSTLFSLFGLGHTRLSPQALISLSLGDDVQEQILASRAHIGEVLGKVDVLQTQQECLDAITALNDTAMDDTSCAEDALAISNSFNGSNLVSSCDAYRESCAATSLTYVSVIIDALNACKTITFTDAQAAMEVAFLQLGAVIAISAHLVTNVVCLEIEREYCGVTISAALDDIDGDTLDTCGEQFTNTSVTCTDVCNNAADEFIDAGCCVAGFLGVSEALFSILDPEEDSNGGIVIEARLCGQGFGSCPEMAALFNDAGIELMTNGGTGLGPSTSTLLLFLGTAVLLLYM